MASSKAFPEQRSCAMTALRRFPHRSDTCSHPCRCRGPDSWGIFSLSKPEPYVTWMRNFSHTGFSACCVECELKALDPRHCHPEAQPKDLLQHRRTETSVAWLFNQKSGPHVRGRGALPRASSQMLQEVLRLRLRMTPEDNNSRHL